MVLTPTCVTVCVGRAGVVRGRAYEQAGHRCSCVREVSVKGPSGVSARRYLSGGLTGSIKGPVCAQLVWEPEACLCPEGGCGWRPRPLWLPAEGGAVGLLRVCGPSPGTTLWLLGPLWSDRTHSGREGPVAWMMMVDRETPPAPSPGGHFLCGKIPLPCNPAHLQEWVCSGL